MASDRPQRISIGFQGGQVLAARVAPDDLKGLRRALDSGRWHELATADQGTVALNLAQVVYVNVEADDHTVGFGT
jgi:hypothetical protein